MKKLLLLYCVLLLSAVAVISCSKRDCGCATLNVAAGAYVVSATEATVWGSVTSMYDVEIAGYGIVCMQGQSIVSIDTLYGTVGGFWADLTSLTPSTAYTFYAFAIDGSGNTVESSEGNFMTDAYKGPVYPEAPDMACVKINGTWWAPVNCGYDETHPYGLLYQWGRRFGQGYGDELPAADTISLLPVDIVEGNSEENKDKYFYGNACWTTQHHGRGDNWFDIYNPCPTGWRVPTFEEMGDLCFTDYDASKHSGEKLRGQWDTTGKGWNFGGVFLPAAGLRDYLNTHTYNRGEKGCYWSSSTVSTVPDSSDARYLAFYFKDARPSFHIGRANGHSVRCVME